MLRRRAVIDLAAFASNLSVSGLSVLDARADAFGHGLALVAPVALEAGARKVVVSDERDAAIAIAGGFSSKMVIIDRDGAGAGSRAYGLDGVGIPVMSVIGEVVAVKAVPAGSGVSYGYTYRTATTTQLALVALGYADGVPRLASNRAQVLVGGGLRPLVGRVAMDQFVVDCGDDVPEVGSDAVLFGDSSRGEPSALDWAEWTERDALALTAGIASRVKRGAR